MYFFLMSKYDILQVVATVSKNAEYFTMGKTLQFQDMRSACKFKMTQI